MTAFTRARAEVGAWRMRPGSPGSCPDAFAADTRPPGAQTDLRRLQCSGPRPADHRRRHHRGRRLGGGATDRHRHVGRAPTSASTRRDAPSGSRPSTSGAWKTALSPRAGKSRTSPPRLWTGARSPSRHGHQTWRRRPPPKPHRAGTRSPQEHRTTLRARRPWRCCSVTKACIRADLEPGSTADPASRASRPIPGTADPAAPPAVSGAVPGTCPGPSCSNRVWPCPKLRSPARNCRPSGELGSKSARAYPPVNRMRFREFHCGDRALPRLAGVALRVTTGKATIASALAHQRESFCVKPLAGASSVVCPCIAVMGLGPAARDRAD